MIDPSEFNFEDAVKPYAMPDGHQCRVRIINVRRNTKRVYDTEVVQYNVQIEIMDETFAKEIYQNYDYPTSKFQRDYPKMFNRQLFNWKEFCNGFDISLTEASDPMTDWRDKEADVILSRTEDDTYGEQNRIKRYV